MHAWKIRYRRDRRRDRGRGAGGRFDVDLVVECAARAAFLFGRGFFPAVGFARPVAGGSRNTGAVVAGFGGITSRGAVAW